MNDTPDVLARELAALGRRIDEAYRDVRLADAVVDELATRQSTATVDAAGRRFAVTRSGWWKGAAAVALVVGSLAAVPGTRQAIARWLGFDSVRVERVPGTFAPPASGTPTAATSATSDTSGPTPDTSAATSATRVPAVSVPVSLPRSFGLDGPVPAAAARARTGLAVPELAGRSGAAVYTTDQPAKLVVVAYPTSADLPPTATPGVGALLSALPGTLPGDWVWGKRVQYDGTVQFVEVHTAGGATVDGIWIAGPLHLVAWQGRGATAADDDVLVDDARLAGNTLLWQEGDVVYRLEAAVGRAAALRLAATVTVAAAGSP